MRPQPLTGRDIIRAVARKHGWGYQRMALHDLWHDLFTRGNMWLKVRYTTDGKVNHALYPDGEVAYLSADKRHKVLDILTGPGE